MALETNEIRKFRNMEWWDAGRWIMEFHNHRRHFLIKGSNQLPTFFPTHGIKCSSLAYFEPIIYYQSVNYGQFSPVAAIVLPTAGYECSQVNNNCG